MSQKAIVFLITSVILGLLTLSIVLLIEIGDQAYIKEELRSKVSYIESEADTLAYIQKMMVVSYPQITKWEAKYYSYIIRDFSKEYNTPASLMVALIGIESGWSHIASSYANCKGLGQLSPAAAKDESIKIGIKYKEGITEFHEIHNLVMSFNRFCSRHESKGRDFAVRSYIGGDSFYKTLTKEGKNAKYIKSYDAIIEKEEIKVKKILHEANKLMYIYGGIIREYENDTITKEQQKIVNRIRDNNPTVNLIR